MNRFALLDSDNEDEKPKNSSVTVDKKKKADAPAANAAKTAAPAAKSAEAPKKVVGDNKPKANDANKKPANGGKAPVPGQKVDKPKAKPEAAAPSGGEGEVVEASGSGKAEGKRDQRSHGKAPRTRFEKRQDESHPHIKPDNRIRGGAHSNTKRRPSKNADKQEVEGLAKEGEKHPEAFQAPEGEVEEEAPKVPEVPAEPEPTTFSLDEYQKRREEARAKSSILTAEKVGRAVEELSGLKIKEEDESGVYTGTSKASKSAKAAQRSNGKSVVTDLGFKVEAAEEARPPREERRTPSARGAPRTGRPASGSKGPRVDLADVNAFPSL